MGVFEFARAMIQEQVRAGLAWARASGKEARSADSGRRGEGRPQGSGGPLARHPQDCFGLWACHSTEAPLVHGEELAPRHAAAGRAPARPRRFRKALGAHKHGIRKDCFGLWCRGWIGPADQGGNVRAQTANLIGAVQASVGRQGSMKPTGRKRQPAALPGNEGRGCPQEKTRWPCFAVGAVPHCMPVD
jgi:hypothetical protein